MLKLSMDEDIDLTLDKVLTVYRRFYGRDPRAIILGQSEMKRLTKWMKATMKRLAPEADRSGMITIWRGVPIHQADTKKCLAVDIGDIGPDRFAKGFNCKLDTSERERAGRA